MPSSDLLDLSFLGRPNVVGVYLLRGSETALVDCGPTTTVASLRARLADHGLSIQDIHHLLLTHIHLDHAGGAGTLVREHPRLQVHVSGIGAPHLADPARLERSARRLYGDTFDDLWGEIVPIPEQNIRVVKKRVLELDILPTPGHASHHVAYLDSDGACYAGDATGVRLFSSRFVAPHAPPPDIDLKAWRHSIEEIANRRPSALCLPHFGIVQDPPEHIDLMWMHLRVWAERVRAGIGEVEFVRAAEADLRRETEPEVAELYRIAAPFWQSYAGLRRAFGMTR